MSFLSPSGGDRLSPVALATAGAVGASIVVQLLTPADPFGKSARFLRQLGRQVRGYCGARRRRRRECGSNACSEVERVEWWSGEDGNSWGLWTARL